MNCVQPGSFLTLHYRLSGPDGADVVNTFDDKPATLSLGSGQLAPAMVARDTKLGPEEITRDISNLSERMLARLLGLGEGAHQTFHRAPGESFGERNPDMLQRVARKLLREMGEPGEEYAPGDVVRFPTPDGQGAFAGVVRETGDDWLLFDFNHPLAGQALSFEVQLIGVL